jgi:hypothetical protein
VSGFDDSGLAAERFRKFLNMFHFFLHVKEPGSTLSQCFVKAVQNWRVNKPRVMELRLATEVRSRLPNSARLASEPIPLGERPYTALRKGLIGLIF